MKKMLLITALATVMSSGLALGEAERLPAMGATGNLVTGEKFIDTLKPMDDKANTTVITQRLRPVRSAYIVEAGPMREVDLSRRVLREGPPISITPGLSKAYKSGGERDDIESIESLQFLNSP